MCLHWLSYFKNRFCMLFSRNKFTTLGNICQVLQYFYSLAITAQSGWPLVEIVSELISSPSILCSHLAHWLSWRVTHWVLCPKASYFLLIVSLDCNLFHHNSGSWVICSSWDGCEGPSGPFSFSNVVYKLKETGVVHLYDTLEKAELWVQKTGQWPGFRLKEGVW